MISIKEYHLLERGKKYFMVNKIFFGEPVIIHDKTIYIGEFLENKTIANYDYVFSHFTDISVIHKLKNNSLICTFQNSIKKDMEKRRKSPQKEKNNIVFSLSNRNYYFFTCNITDELLEEIRSRYRVSLIKDELMGLWYIPINESNIVPFFIGGKYRESKESFINGVRGI